MHELDHARGVQLILGEDHACAAANLGFARAARAVARSVSPGGQGGYMDGVEGAVEITMRAGDCLLFVDCLTHGSTKRQISGARRAVIFRYAPRWTAPPAPQPWMAQLTDDQKALLATQL